MHVLESRGDKERLSLKSSVCMLLSQQIMPEMEKSRFSNIVISFTDVNTKKIDQKELKMAAYRESEMKDKHRKHIWCFTLCICATQKLKYLYCFKMKN